MKQKKVLWSCWTHQVQQRMLAKIRMEIPTAPAVPSLLETVPCSDKSEGFTKKHLSPKHNRKTSQFQHFILMQRFQEPRIGNKWWHMAAESSSKVFSFKHNFFLPFFFGKSVSFLWYAEEKEGLGVCSAHVRLSQPFIRYPNREKGRDLKEGKTRKKRRSCRMYVREKEKGGGEEMKRWLWLHLAISSPQRDSIKQ